MIRLEAALQRAAGWIRPEREALLSAWVRGMADARGIGEAEARVGCTAALDALVERLAAGDVEGPGAAVTRVALADTARVRHGARPVGEHGVPLRPEPPGRPLERRLQPDHRGFSPRWRYAMPSVSGWKRTAPKPACSMRAANTFGFGKLATDAGRYA